MTWWQFSEHPHSAVLELDSFPLELFLDWSSGRLKAAWLDDEGEVLWSPVVGLS